MNPQHALESAMTELQRVIDAAPLSDETRSGPTPCSGFTVEQLCEHIIDTHNLLLAGAGGDTVTRLGSLGHRHSEVAAAAVAQWAMRGTAGTINLGGNELPAVLGQSLHTLETFIHGWDLARSLNLSFEPSSELTSNMWGFAQEFITDDVRGDEGAPYRSAMRAPTDATDLERIIALSGRDPHWRRG